MVHCVIICLFIQKTLDLLNIFDKDKTFINFRANIFSFNGRKANLVYIRLRFRFLFLNFTHV